MPVTQIPQIEPDIPERAVTDVVIAARQGDPRAWAELIQRYGGLVRRVVARYRLSEADAADAVQSTWCKAFEQLAAVRDPERLGAWLSTTAGRECLATIRRTRRERPDDAAVEARLDPATGPEAVVLAAEVERAVLSAVEELEPRRRQLVHELFYRPERDYSQVSRAMGIPVGSIGPTRGRVLVSLRSRLVRAGFGPQYGAGGCGCPGGLSA
jgi:RNA polymerase sigma factor (sigma-70 family)